MWRYSSRVTESFCAISLSRELRPLAGVDMVVTFGNTLHVSGTNATRLQHTLTPYLRRAGFTWTQIEASLEDVFIVLMKAAKDNFE